MSFLFRRKKTESVVSDGEFALHEYVAGEEEYDKERLRSLCKEKHKDRMVEKDSQGMTPLMIAVKTRKAKVVKELLHRQIHVYNLKIDFKQKNKDNKTLVDLVEESDSVEIHMLFHTFFKDIFSFSPTKGLAIEIHRIASTDDLSHVLQEIFALTTKGTYNAEATAAFIKTLGERNFDKRELNSVEVDLVHNIFREIKVQCLTQAGLKDSFQPLTLIEEEQSILHLLIKYDLYELAKVILKMLKAENEHILSALFNHKNKEQLTPLQLCAVVSDLYEYNTEFELQPRVRFVEIIIEYGYKLNAFTRYKDFATPNIFVVLLDNEPWRSTQKELAMYLLAHEIKTDFIVKEEMYLQDMVVSSGVVEILEEFIATGRLKISHFQKNEDETFMAKFLKGLFDYNWNRKGDLPDNYELLVEKVLKYIRTMCLRKDELLLTYEHLTDSKMSSTVLHQCVKYNNVFVLNWICDDLQKEKPELLKQLLDSQDTNGNTPFVFGARASLHYETINKFAPQSRVGICSKLLDYGCDINAKGNVVRNMFGFPLISQLSALQFCLKDNPDLEKQEQLALLLIDKDIVVEGHLIVMEEGTQPDGDAVDIVSLENFNLQIILQLVKKKKLSRLTSDVNGDSDTFIYQFLLNYGKSKHLLGKQIDMDTLFQVLEELYEISIESDSETLELLTQYSGERNFFHWAVSFNVPEIIPWLWEKLKDDHLNLCAELIQKRSNSGLSPFLLCSVPNYHFELHFGGQKKMDRLDCAKALHIAGADIHEQIEMGPFMFNAFALAAGNDGASEAQVALAKWLLENNVSYDYESYALEQIYISYNPELILYMLEGGYILPTKLDPAEFEKSIIVQFLNSLAKDRLSSQENNSLETLIPILRFLYDFKSETEDLKEHEALLLQHCNKNIFHVCVSLNLPDVLKWIAQELNKDDDVILQFMLRHDTPDRQGTPLVMCVQTSHYFELKIEEREKTILSRLECAEFLIELGSDVKAKALDSDGNEANMLEIISNAPFDMPDLVKILNQHGLI